MLEKALLVLAGVAGATLIASKNKSETSETQREVYYRQPPEISEMQREIDSKNLAENELENKFLTKYVKTRSPEMKRIRIRLFLISGILLILFLVTAAIGLPISILFMFSAIILLLIITTNDKLQKLTRTYYKLIISGENRISKISEYVKLEQSIVIEHLREMIGNGFFTGAKVDIHNNIFLLPDQIQYYDFNRQNQNTVVVCNSCGANNTVIYGVITECKYCGTTING